MTGANAAGVLVPLVVLIPIVAAVVAALLPARGRATMAVASVLASGTVVGLLWAEVAASGPIRVELAGWTPPLGIAMQADGAGIAMLALAHVVLLAAFAAAAVDGRLIGSEAFWPLVLFAAAAISGVFVAADLFTVYVVLELLTLAAVALVALGGARAAAAALRYLFVAVIGSLFYLLAVALVYGQTGTLDLSLAAERMPDGPVAAAVLALVTVGMAAKMALFPLHSWLPVAHPAAPAAVSALLSALVIKASLFVLWRVYAAFGMGLDLAPAFATATAAAGAAGVIWGGVMALRRDRLKTVIAYSTVAQVGYLVLILPLMLAGAEGGVDADAAARAAGWSGGVVLAVAHGLAKAAMFLAAGALVIAYGTDRLSDLRGALARMPLAAATIGVAGVSLAGLPPTLGFVGKWQLLESALASGAWWWVAVLLVGGLLTFGYVAKMIRAMFSPPGDDPAPPHGVPHRALSIVPFALASASVVVGVFPAPLVALVEGGLS
ncbi:MAG: proton-conducting transporter membrane subunit [Microbacterium arborescens]